MILFNCAGERESGNIKCFGVVGGGGGSGDSDLRARNSLSQQINKKPFHLSFPVRSNFKNFSTFHVPIHSIRHLTTSDGIN